MPVDVLAILRAAAYGLNYPSEQDAPFEAFRWPGAKWPDARSAVLSDCGYDPGDPLPPVEEVPPDRFFAELDRAAGAEGFQRLRTAVESTLGAVKVFRVGKVELAIYVVGRTAAGDWAGVWTTAVET